MSVCFDMFYHFQQFCVVMGRFPVLLFYTIYWCLALGTNTVTLPSMSLKLATLQLSSQSNDVQSNPLRPTQP